MKPNYQLYEKVFSSKGRARIIKILAIENEMNISKIVKEARICHSSVINHLSYLQKVGFVQEKKFGKIRIFRFKNENLKAKALKNLINFWENDYED